MYQVVWVGAVVVTVNAKLLGGNVSFFQNICLLGYCVAPMIAATGLCMLVHLLLPDTTFSCGAGPHTTCFEDGRFDLSVIELKVRSSKYDNTMSLSYLAGVWMRRT